MPPINDSHKLFFARSLARYARRRLRMDAMQAELLDLGRAQQNLSAQLHKMFGIDHAITFHGVTFVPYAEDGGKRRGFDILPALDLGAIVLEGDEALPPLDELCPEARIDDPADSGWRADGSPATVEFRPASQVDGGVHDDAQAVPDSDSDSNSGSESDPLPHPNPAVDSAG